MKQPTKAVEIAVPQELDADVRLGDQLFCASNISREEVFGLRQEQSIFSSRTSPANPPSGWGPGWVRANADQRTFGAV